MKKTKSLSDCTIPLRSFSSLVLNEMVVHVQQWCLLVHESLDLSSCSRRLSSASSQAISDSASARCSCFLLLDIPKRFDKAVRNIFMAICLFGVVSTVLDKTNPGELVVAG